MTTVPRTVIQLSEQSAADGRFRVKVVFPGAEYDTEIVDPANEAAEQELAWYFEEHLHYPFLDKDRERSAVGRIAAYGTALFRQVFAGKAGYSYRKLRERSFDNCRLEISGSAALHRLHWEALRDPDQPDIPLALLLPVTRRVEGQPMHFGIRDDLPTLNILVVTARPGGPRDVGYRTISQPLLDALRNADLPVTVDLVRPGTWGALRAHLAEGSHGPGWYQVIHFDLHGAFTDYETLAQGASEGRLRFSPTALPPFEGQRGFLFFETERDGVAQPVPAGAVASLLAENRVPVAVLNACQSAMQTVSEAGLAQRLAEAGVPVTVGMAYSVTVTAAERAMPVLYERLAEGADPVTAAHAARRELFEHRGRLVYYDQQLDLEDWMLPVVFRQHPLRVELRGMTDAEHTVFDERSAAVAGEPATEYGFVGRDLDIQAIERHLLAGKDSNELLVRGLAGAGKSTLLAHLAWWWQRTGLVGQVFRFSYEDRPWSAHQIVRDIRAKLFTPAEHAAADSRSEDAQLEQVTQRLRAHRHLLLLDNAESITTTSASVPHALSAEERAKLKTLLSRLHGGATLVLLGSREPETWLTSDSGPGVYPLPGLDPQAASTLVDRIMERHGAAGYLADVAERGALQDLVDLLGGYPLPLTVVLPVLATTTPSEVLRELREGGPGADPAGLIDRAIEYSYGKLDESLQNSLLALAPFISVIPVGPPLERYQQLLLQEEAGRALGQIDLAGAVGRAITVGLAAPHPQVDDLIQVQPMLPYFLRTRLLGKPILQAATGHAHYLLHESLATNLYRMLMTGDEPEQRLLARAITQAEFANLTAAVTFGLRAGRLVSGLLGALCEHLAQSQQYDVRRQLLDQAIAAYPVPANDDQLADLAVLEGFAGQTAFAQRRFGDARTHYEAELRLREETADGRIATGVIYNQLGMIAQAQRQFAEAEAHYRQALSIYLELGNGDHAATTYGQLGGLAADQRRPAEADAYYRQAAEAYLEFGDRYSAARIYGQQGDLAAGQRRFAEARAYYHQALSIYLEFGSRDRTAGIYLALSTIALEERRPDAAETYCRHALDVYLEFGDQLGIAHAHHTLGILAHEQQRFTEAEANYRRALHHHQERGDQHNVAVGYHQLGRVAYEQRRFAEAESNYRQGLDIFRQLGDQRRASITATQLGVFLAILGRHEEALPFLLDIAVAWRQEQGQWPEYHLRWLHRERAVAGAGAFTALLHDHVPEELLGELNTAIDASEDPPEGDSLAGGLVRA